MRVAVHPREQPQLRGGRVGVAGSDRPLLRHDQLDGRLVDRQPASLPGDLRHVVHQHPELALAPAVVELGVVVQAVDGQDADLVRSPPGVGQQLDRPTRRQTMHPLQQPQRWLVEQLRDDRVGQSPRGRSRRAARGAADIVAGQRELGRQPEHRPPLSTQPEIARAAQEVGDIADQHRPAVSADPPGRVRSADPRQEQRDVGTTQLAGVIAAVLAAAQRPRQLGDRDHRAAGGAGVDQRRSLARPLLGQLAQPRLADRREVDDVGLRLAEHPHVPPIAPPLHLRVDERQAQVILRPGDEQTHRIRPQAAEVHAP